nr:MAG: hypothetical protein [Microvirus sp.]
MRTWITIISPINGSSYTFYCDRLPTLRETFMRAYFLTADCFDIHFSYGEALYICDGHSYKINKSCNPYRSKH